MRISDWSSDVCSSDLKDTNAGKAVADSIPARRKIKVSLTNRKIGVQDVGSFSTRLYVGQRPNEDSFHDQADMRAGKRLPSPIGANSGIRGPARKSRSSQYGLGRVRGTSQGRTPEG